MSKKPSNNADFPIKIIKMKQGETIITRVKKIENAYIFKDPFLIVYMPCFDKNGNMTSTEMSFRNWIDGSSIQEFTIPFDAVLLETECEISIQIMYEKVVSEENNPIFYDDYLKETTDFYENKKGHPKKKKKNHGASGPDRERLKDGEDDLDTDGWQDFPPRYK